MDWTQLDDPTAAAQAQELARRSELAKVLMQRGMQPIQGQMAGRFYVPPSWAQGLSQLGSAAAGASLGKEVGSDQTALAEALQARRQQQVSEFDASMNPKSVEVPAQGPGAPVVMSHADLANKQALGASPEMIDSYAQMRTEGPQPTATVMQPPSERDKRKALLDAMTSSNPLLREAARFQTQQEALAQEKELNRSFMGQQNDLNRMVKTQGQEAQLNTMMMLGLITKEQKEAAMKQQADTAKQHDQTLKTIAEMNKTSGKTPPGYRTTADGNLEPIPGGPADNKLQGALNQDTSMLQNSNASFDRLASTANEILNHPGLAGITGVRGKVPDLPGSDAANARALLNTLKSQVGFGVLQEMRNNSKTGGALGSVSDAEGKRLENNLAALDTSQGIDQFKKELQAIVEYANGAKDRLREAYNMKHKTGEPVPMKPATQGPTVGTVEGGYRFKGGDPAKAESWEKVQ